MKCLEIEIKTVRLSPRFCLYGENERLINSKDLTINIKYYQAEDKSICPGKRCVL